MRKRVDADLTERIGRTHEAPAGTYGAPRVHAELRAQGRRHSRKRVARLMRTAGFCGRTPKRWRTTTVPDPTAEPRPDLVGREFTTNPVEVDARWCGDITYINTWEGWLYLATVIDLASRRVVGWATADHLRTDLPAQALSNAIASRRPGGPVIFHSDRGCQGGSFAGGAQFEVSLRGSTARVCLMDVEHYHAYLDGDEYEYHGGFWDVSPVVLEVPYDGYWYLVVDSNVRRISVEVAQIFD